MGEILGNFWGKNVVEYITREKKERKKKEKREEKKEKREEKKKKEGGKKTDSGYNAALCPGIKFPFFSLTITLLILLSYLTLNF